MPYTVHSYIYRRAHGYWESESEATFSSQKWVQAVLGFCVPAHVQRDGTDRLENTVFLQIKYAN